MTHAHISRLKSFLLNLADVFDGALEIEKIAQQELRSVSEVVLAHRAAPLPDPIVEVMQGADAHPLCQEILSIPFDWCPPQTSLDPLYAKHSAFKSHVEFLGPDGLAKSDVVRLGLYGMLPHSEYGVRTHPVEEIYVMLAGDCLWKRGDHPYEAEAAWGRSYHPSMMPHATKTRDKAFMSVYVWIGDLSKDSYVYNGLPETL